LTKTANPRALAVKAMGIAQLQPAREILFSKEDESIVLGAIGYCLLPNTSEQVKMLACVFTHNAIQNSKI